MTRLEKIQLAIEKGFTYDEVSGKIYGIHGKEIIGRNNKGYIMFQIYNDKKPYSLKGHQFAYYIKYKKITNQIDHINGIKDDNRICNLREIDHKKNQFNRKVKGYYLDKNTNRFRAKIVLNNKSIQLGYFDTEEEAHQAYLDAKNIYHIM